MTVHPTFFGLTAVRLYCATTTLRAITAVSCVREDGVRLRCARRAASGALAVTAGSLCGLRVTELRPPKAPETAADSRWLNGPGVIRHLQADAASHQQAAAKRKATAMSGEERQQQSGATTAKRAKRR